eukprot:scaffold311030_cov33-Prasinocladus_malaysianus.AAC.2
MNKSQARTVFHEDIYVIENGGPSGHPLVARPALAGLKHTRVTQWVRAVATASPSCLISIAIIAHCIWSKVPGCSLHRAKPPTAKKRLAITLDDD